MANRNLFSNRNSTVPATDTRNKAGGRAYSVSDEAALCQYVVTGTFNGTFYASAGEQLDEVKKLVDKCSSEVIAKAAVYGHREGRMKDVPAYLVATLAARGETELLRKVFPRVITNVKMLLNFVQIIRSGVTGRRSFGSAVKRLIQEWITGRSNDKLFIASIGHSKPSLVDVIKMVHPRPVDPGQNATLGYLLGKDYDGRRLPAVVKQFEAFKRDTDNPLPDMPFMALSNCNMNTSHWEQIAQNMPWNTLRMNLNNLKRHGVFDNRELVRHLAGKLANPEEVRKWNAFPYQLMTAYQNATDIPGSIKAALNDALEVSTENVPKLNGDVAVCVDVSGSMGQSITGWRMGGASSVTRCVDVAALMAACMLRQNPDATILGWDTRVYTVNLNPRDSVITNTQKIRLPGGGTDASVALQHLNDTGWKGSTVIYVSDNESWYGQPSYYNRGTNMASEWAKFKRRNRNAKLACIDVVPGQTVQVPDDNSVLNIGGFNDSVFKVIDNFVNNDSDNRRHFADVVKATTI